MTKYSKSITALVTGVLGWCGVVTSSVAGPISASEWLALGVAVATTLGVYGVSNAPRSERGAVEPGSLALGLILGVLLAFLLWGYR